MAHEHESPKADAAPKAKTQDDPAALRRSPHLIAIAPAAIKLDEAVVGSDDWFELGPILSITGMPTMGILRSWCESHSSSAAMAAVASSMGVGEEALAASGMTELAGETSRKIWSGESNALRVRYRPTRVGETRAVLHYIIQTHDGAMSKGSVLIHARARALDAAPSKRAATRAPATVVADPTTTSASEESEPVSKDFEGSVQRARDAAIAIADSQQGGVDRAKGDASAYKRKEIPKSGWLTLAEIAISMGIAGVAGVVAKSLSSKLAGYVEGGEAARLIVGITDGLKEGGKLTGKHILLGGAGNKNGSQTPDDEDGDELSSNALNDFWERQGQLLRGAKRKNAATITDVRDKLLPKYAENPGAAIATMDRVAAGLSADHDSVTDYQALQSTLQFVSGIAQSTHGHNQVATRDGERNVTDMSTARDQLGAIQTDGNILERTTQAMQEASRRARVDGVLQLEVEIPWDAPMTSTSVVVRNATLNGVAQEVADRLAKRPLRELAIPMRIDVIGGPAATITRDEVGRIRVDGFLPREESPTAATGLEVENLKAATQLVDLVLAKKLSSWSGGYAIETDDATGRDG